MEITNRFPTDSTARRAIADDVEAAARAFAALAAGLPAGHLVVACWTKPQFSNDRSYPVRDAEMLKYVMSGVLDGHCRALRFFHEPNSRAPQTAGLGFRTLFLS
ncbi:MAG TPA: hypothetical protein VJM46_02735 [Candidatus Saccharimonadales bacterium]|nr:hypothetical protein [Candidatus Saccharimonadales bacterium]